MRSRANRVRVELALRIVALVALAAWIANAARPATARREVVRGAALGAALQRWTQGGGGRSDRVHVQLDTVPDAASLAWLAALRGAGVGVSWGGSIPAVAVETYAAADPAGGVFVLAGGSTRSPRILGDALGPMDTVAGSATSDIVRLGGAEGQITLTSGPQPARADAASRVVPRRVFVSGAAGWEAKFVVAALEERGWTVDAQLFLAPGRDAQQGARATLDTGRYSAAVLLDSAAAARARVERFAREGGGVVFAGDANRATSAAPLVAWRAGKRELAPLGTLPGDTAWRGLSRFPLDTIADRRAIALESRNGRPVVAVRRHYAGRVAGVGYDQTWRWRMAGGDSGQVQHREWWSRVVSSVALRPSPVIPSRVPAERASRDLRFGAAPLASLHDVLGPPSTSTRAPPAMLSPNALSNVLGLMCLVTLLTEWMLRRSRGAR